MHHVCLDRELQNSVIRGTVKLRTEAPPTVTPSRDQ